MRIGLFASLLPLACAAAFMPAPSTTPPLCMPLATGAAQLTTSPRLAAIRVGFTADAARASATVAVVDTPENADFAVIDDGPANEPSNEPSACAAAQPLRLVGIIAQPAAGDVLIRFGSEADADYRVHVASRSFTAEQAAALIVGAHRPLPIVAAALRGEP